MTKPLITIIALLLATFVPSSVTARCGRQRPTVENVETMLEDGDYQAFKAQYSGFDCLVAFYDSLSMLWPLLERDSIVTWSSPYTFLPKLAPLARDPERCSAYCSMWMRGLFWIYLSANGKRIRGKEEGRLCCAAGPVDVQPPFPVYDVTHCIAKDPWEGQSRIFQPYWELDEGLLRTLDQLYCDALLDSNEMRSFAQKLNANLKASDFVWKVEEATVYNAVTPLFGDRKQIALMLKELKKRDTTDFKKNSFK
jgi:hypothetical protein